MTGFMHEKEFSRKTFVKGGGSLVIGFSALGAVAGKAQGATGNTPFSQRGPQDAGSSGEHGDRLGPLQVGGFGDEGRQLVGTDSSHDRLQALVTHFRLNSSPEP